MRGFVNNGSMSAGYSEPGVMGGLGGALHVSSCIGISCGGISCGYLVQIAFHINIYAVYCLINQGPLFGADLAAALL